MIEELHVRNVALIREATIEPSRGLTVLTGETGAGKTALLSSLKLLVGERADAGMVREGTEALEVEGLVSGTGDEEEPDGVVVRRRVAADGRGRAYVDGSLASVKELAARIGSTVDLCGQHEHQRLLSNASHRQLLDAWAGEPVERASAEYREALAAATAAQRALDEARMSAKEGSERLEEARFTLARIDEINPQEGELEELEAALPRMEHGEALVAAAHGARALISDEGGAIDALSEASRLLSGAAAHDAQLGDWAERIETALIDVGDVASELRSYADNLEFDPESLEVAQTRMAALEGLMRTFGPGMAQVLERREKARVLVEAATDGGARERELEQELITCEKRLVKAANALDAARLAAAPGLVEAVGQQTARLEMGSAGIEVSVERLSREQWASAGPSRIEFLYRPAAGLTARPLRKIASGGEASRVMLALKVVLGAVDDCQTLVFDEVDAGVGGATAVALASVLAELAQTHQVLVVTHLAQVAVVADRHYLVKKIGDDRPETTLSSLEGEDRVAEIARMLSGDVGAASRDLAREMLVARQG